MSVLIFIFGLCIGSFLNVVIYRLPRGGSIVMARSRCPYCSVTLRWYNLCPVLSFILQRGRCARCGNAISFRYPFIEMLTGLVFFLIWKYYGLSWQAAGFWALSALLVAASFIDLEHKIIPDEITVAGIISGVVFMIRNGFLPGIAGFLAGGGILLAIAVLSKGNMGGGDIKLAAVIGLFLGWQLLLQALFWGFLLGTVAGVVLIFLGVMKRKDPFPFGPFLALGALVAVLWGQDILQWYLDFVTRSFG